MGKPFDNTQLLILDRWSDLVPLGCVGEICIAGDGLARGYLNNTALTTEKFVAHPFEPGKRMYRTGDFGKYLPDGNLIFIGRKDHQIKIAGHRIELREIEAVILQNFPVDQALATV
ncbi:MAG: hypothetical protein ACKO96_46525, partial [Flammeovirgaceae bacterium]